LAAVTVLVPTHNHGVLLRYAVSSALGQTVREIEVLIVGDGADQATAHEAKALAEADRRVRFLPFPKGPRHGEVHREEALRGARGAIVAYLSDDDLWLPSHLESLIETLNAADFANGRTVLVLPDQSLGVFPGDFSVKGVRERLDGPWNFVGLSSAGHTRALYDRLGSGWETTPSDVFTDLHMWRRLLAVPGCRAATARRPTVLQFPTPDRKEWPLARREAEMREWASRLQDPGFEAELTLRALQAAGQSLAGYDVALEATRRENERLAAECHAVRAEGAAAAERAVRSEESRSAAERRCYEAERDRDATAARLAAEAASLRATAQAMSATLTWRVRNRLAALPGVAAAWRRLAALRPRR
jgi:hypothetical protein